MSAWTIAGGIILAWLLMLVVVLAFGGLMSAAAEATPMLRGSEPGATG